MLERLCDRSPYALRIIVGLPGRRRQQAPGCRTAPWRRASLERGACQN